jgi:hypothetical protein
MNGRDNQEWAIQGHRQHLAQNEDKQNPQNATQLFFNVQHGPH